MRRVRICCFCICFFFTACAGGTESPTSTLQQPAVDPYALPMERGDYFAASGVCATCHKDMTDGEGNDISIDTYWRGTMMANSSRDPYWQASVRAEVISNPDYNDIIQDKCTTCHTPMARTTRSFEGEAGVLLDSGFLSEDNDLHVLALDGISCTLCHQIDDQLLGEEDSFDGGYVIDSMKKVGERVNYGPYEVTDESVVIMRSASGYIPEESKHVQASEICGSCHTLYTPTVSNTGEVVGLFPEQTPYLEWLASDYPGQNTCQDCHMPEASGEVVLSITGAQGRSKFSKHSFAGGNTYALTLLQVYGEEMNVTASDDQIGAALIRAKDQLQEQTAQIKIEKVEVERSTMTVDVVVESQVGHKFPSGFPSRRVWIHLLVQDASGEIIFESGKWDESGSIYGNQNDLDAAAFEPHYQVIDSPEQVQIYEAIMGDTDGVVTTTLLRGATYLKDNRLLPTGFAKGSSLADIAVSGEASDDLDFLGGRDTIRYLINIDQAEGPFTVVAEILYQSIGYRWAENLNRFDAVEPKRFAAYYQAVPNLPTSVAAVTIKIEE